MAVPAKDAPTKNGPSKEIPAAKCIAHKDMSLLREMAREESVHSAVTDGSNMRTDGSNIQRCRLILSTV